MKNYNPQNTKKVVVTGYEKDFLFEEVAAQDLEDVISDVLAYSEDYEILMDSEEVEAWF